MCVCLVLNVKNPSPKYIEGKKCERELYEQCFSTKKEGNHSPPQSQAPIPSSIYVNTSIPGLPCHSMHNTRTHSAVPMRTKLNGNMDSKPTLCYKVHCFSLQFFFFKLEFPLCCLNVYMEPLGGLVDRCLVHEHCLSASLPFPRQG